MDDVFFKVNIFTCVHTVSATWKRATIYIKAGSDVGKWMHLETLMLNSIKQAQWALILYGFSCMRNSKYKEQNTT